MRTSPFPRGFLRVRRPEEGSAVLLALMACLTVAVGLQVLTVVVLCAERAVVEETRGREDLAKRDGLLVALRVQAEDGWTPTNWSAAEGEGGPPLGRLAEVEGSKDWVLGAEVSDGSGMKEMFTSVWVERGRDGVDLPRAAVVAEWVVVAPGRITPWLDGMGATAGLDSPDIEGEAPEAYVAVPPAGGYVGEGCVTKKLPGPWALDEGWRDLLRSAALQGGRVVVMTGSDGQTLQLVDEATRGTPERPLMIVVTGGADLDARWVGDLHCVLVVDGGSVTLDGTMVHGALLVTGKADFGLGGQVMYSPSALQWAKDLSIRRTRLVPGTRSEGTG